MPNDMVGKCFVSDAERNCRCIPLELTEPGAESLGAAHERAINTLMPRVAAINPADLPGLERHLALLL